MINLKDSTILMEKLPDYKFYKNFLNNNKNFEKIKKNESNSWILITTNDSRIRLYNVLDRTFEVKYKGLINNSNQIGASISHDFKYIISGSEDNKTYIWKTVPNVKKNEIKLPKFIVDDFESFQSNSDITTVSCFAPKLTQELLLQTNDPIYNYTLSSFSPSTSSPTTPSTNSTFDIPQSQSQSQSNLQNPSSINDDSIFNSGRIIITTDLKGKIRIFRQDCDFKRRNIKELIRLKTFSKLNKNSNNKTINSLMTRAHSSDVVKLIASGTNVNTTTTSNSSSNGTDNVRRQSLRITRNEIAEMSYI